MKLILLVNFVDVRKRIRKVKVGRTKEDYRTLRDEALNSDSIHLRDNKSIHQVPSS